MYATAWTETAQMRLTVADIVAATGASLPAGCTPLAAFSGVGTDSRTLDPGELFVALRGEHFDGHEFVAAALAGGAEAALVDCVVPGVDGSRLLVVGDTLRALGDLAALMRRRSSMRVVAVTGSNGKTTTKEMIAAICEHACAPRHKVLKTQGNLNNLIGLPLTLLRADGDEAVGVLELGMNQPGEIARLTEIARPDFAVVTNVGHAHLERLGSLAGVAEEKGELYAGLPNDAVIAVNQDDEWVVRIAARFRGRRVTFGRDGDVQAAAVRNFGVDGMGFDLVIDDERRPVRLPFVGVHNVANALAAAALAHAMGIGLDAIVAGLSRRSAAQMRMQVIRLANGVTVINDAYNANPESTEAALRAVQLLPGRSVAVLGDMWELGSGGRRAHREIGARVASLGFDELFVVGALADEIEAGALEVGMPAAHVHVLASNAAAAEAVRAAWRGGDVVLVKGSRGMRMEEIVCALEDAGRSP